MEHSSQKGFEAREQVYAKLDVHVFEYFRGHSVQVISSTDSKLLSHLPRLSYYVISPGPRMQLWCYISRGAWEIIHDDLEVVEFVIVSEHFEQPVLTLQEQLINYHSFAKGQLRLGQVVPIGDPWLPHSSCDHMLVSHPYPFGRKFEDCVTEDFTIKLLWAVPITRKEAEYKSHHGFDALERLFEQQKISYWKSDRDSLV